MPPRISPLLDQPHDAPEMAMGDLVRELERMNHCLDAFEEHQRRVHNTPARTDPRYKEEEENRSLQEMFSDEEFRPSRFRVSY